MSSCERCGKSAKELIHVILYNESGIFSVPDENGCVTDWCSTEARNYDVFLICNECKQKLIDFFGKSYTNTHVCYKWDGEKWISKAGGEWSGINETT